jgi:hypothetical protein
MCKTLMCRQEKTNLGSLEIKSKKQKTTRNKYKKEFNFLSHAELLLLYTMTFNPSYMHAIT